MNSEFEINPELISFMSDFFKGHHFKLPVDLQTITLETSVDLDLNLYDLDMDLFLSDFVKKFNIDYSEFDWNNHGGYPKFLSLRYWFYKLLFRNNPELLKRKLNQIYVPKLKVGDLQNAITTGKLR